MIYLQCLLLNLEQACTWAFYKLACHNHIKASLIWRGTEFRVYYMFILLPRKISLVWTCTLSMLTVCVCVCVCVPCLNICSIDLHLMTWSWCFPCFIESLRLYAMPCYADGFVLLWSVREECKQVFQWMIWSCMRAMFNFLPAWLCKLQQVLSCLDRGMLSL